MGHFLRLDTLAGQRSLWTGLTVAAVLVGVLVLTSTMSRHQIMR
jgi:hypothetical protein